MTDTERQVESLRELFERVLAVVEQLVARLEVVELEQLHQRQLPPVEPADTAKNRQKRPRNRPNAASKR